MSVAAPVGAVDDYPRSMASIPDLDQILAELPEVTEGARYGNPTWVVRSKPFAWLRPFSKADL